MYVCHQLRIGDEYEHICHTCWCRVESFHVYYQEIEEAQQFFDSFDECKVKTEPMDFDCMKYNLDENISGTTSTKGRADDTMHKECDNFQDESGECCKYFFI